MRYTSLSSRIIDYRTGKAVSLRQFAKQLRISAPYLTDIEHGRRFPSSDVLARIAEATQTPIEELRVLDPQLCVKELKKCIMREPEIGFALHHALMRVNTGELSSHSLLQRLKF